MHVSLPLHVELKEGYHNPKLVLPGPLGGGVEYPIEAPRDYATGLGGTKRGEIVEISNAPLVLGDELALLRLRPEGVFVS